MRIVHLCSNLSVEAGGISRFVLDAAFTLARQGLAVTLIGYRQGTIDFPWKDAPPATLTTVLPPGGGAWASSAMKDALAQALVGADVIHLHGMWEPLAATAAGMARARNVPYVCSPHGMLDPWSVTQRRAKKWIYHHLIERRRLRHAAALHFTAAEEARKASPWLPPNVKRVIVPPLMDLTPFETLPPREAAHQHFTGIPGDHPWVLFLSRIHEKKGLDLLIEGVAAMKAQDTQLVIAGSGDEAYVSRLRATAARLLGNRAHFVGMVTGVAKVALLRRADLMALPTSQENFGLVFAEALACETPVLLTNGVDIHQDLIDAGAAALIQRQPADIAARLEERLTDREGTRAMGRAGRHWVFSTLDPNAVGKRWLAEYEAITRRA